MTDINQITQLNRRFHYCETPIMTGRGKYVLGSKPSCSEDETGIILSGSDRVSGNHCKIYYENGAYRVKDLRSRTGTLLNRDKLGQYSREFRIGDEIRIGFKQFDENMNNETDESCFVLSFQKYTAPPQSNFQPELNTSSSRTRRKRDRSPPTPKNVAPPPPSPVTPSRGKRKATQLPKPGKFRSPAPEQSSDSDSGKETVFIPSKSRTRPDPDQSEPQPGYSGGFRSGTSANGHVVKNKATLQEISTRSTTRATSGEQLSKSSPPVVDLCSDSGDNSDDGLSHTSSDTSNTTSNNSGDRAAVRRLVREFINFEAEPNFIKQPQHHARKFRKKSEISPKAKSKRLKTPPPPKTGTSKETPDAKKPKLVLFQVMEFGKVSDKYKKKLSSSNRIKIIKQFHASMTHLAGLKFDTEFIEEGVTQKAKKKKRSRIIESDSDESDTNCPASVPEPASSPNETAEPVASVPGTFAEFFSSVSGPDPFAESRFTRSGLPPGRERISGRILGIDTQPHDAAHPPNTRNPGIQLLNSPPPPREHRRYQGVPRRPSTRTNCTYAAPIPSGSGNITENNLQELAAAPIPVTTQNVSKIKAPVVAKNTRMTRNERYLQDFMASGKKLILKE